LVKYRLSTSASPSSKTSGM